MTEPMIIQGTRKDGTPVDVVYTDAGLVDVKWWRTIIKFDGQEYIIDVDVELVARHDRACKGGPSRRRMEEKIAVFGHFGLPGIGLKSLDLPPEP